VFSFQDGMLITRNGDGKIRGRPMYLLHRDNEENIWMATDFTADKVDEIKGNHDICLTLQSGTIWISVSGTGEIVTDRNKIESLWNEYLKLWFPDGPSSSNLSLIKMKAQSAEYWDNSGPMARLRWIFEAGKAYLQGKKLEEEKLGEHSKVTFTEQQQQAL